MIRIENPVPLGRVNWKETQNNIRFYEREIEKEKTMKKQKPLTFKSLASLVTDLEGKKHQASLADVREILGILRKLIKHGGAYEIMKVLLK